MDGSNIQLLEALSPSLVAWFKAIPFFLVGKGELLTSIVHLFHKS